MFTISLLFLTTLFVGLYAGIHFFNYLGGIPSILRMKSPEAVVEYWQSADYYMGRRMKIVAPGLFLLFLFSVNWFVACGESGTAIGCAVAGALYLGDIAIAVRGNIPGNQKIQSWSLDAVPAEWHSTFVRHMKFFRIRGALMMASYVVMLATAFRYLLSTAAAP